jgi:hypothetical protein
MVVSRKKTEEFGEKPAPVHNVLYECDTWSLIFKEEHTLNLFKNRVLKKIKGTKKQKWQENGENCVMERSIICMMKTRTMRLAENVASTGRWEMCTRFWLQGRKAKIALVNLGEDERKILKQILGNRVWSVD